MFATIPDIPVAFVPAGKEQLLAPHFTRKELFDAFWGGTHGTLKVSIGGDCEELNGDHSKEFVLHQRGIGISGEAIKLTDASRPQDLLMRGVTLTADNDRTVPDAYTGIWFTDEYRSGIQKQLEESEENENNGKGKSWELKATAWWDAQLIVPDIITNCPRQVLVANTGSNDKRYYPCFICDINSSYSEYEWSATERETFDPEYPENTITVTDSYFKTKQQYLSASFFVDNASSGKRMGTFKCCGKTYELVGEAYKREYSRTIEWQDDAGYYKVDDTNEESHTPNVTINCELIFSNPYRLA